LATPYRKFNTITIESGTINRKFNTITIESQYVQVFEGIDTITLGDSIEINVFQSIELSDTINLLDFKEYQLNCNLSDTFLILDNIYANIPLENSKLADSIGLSELYTFQQTLSLLLNDSLSLSELSYINIPQLNQLLSDTLNLTDNIEVNIPLETLNLSDILNLSDNATVSEVIEAPYCTKLFHVNSPYLLLASDGDPAKITKVDITDPANPIWNIYELNNSGESYTNAKDLCVNDIFSRIYVACANGLIADINLSDLEDRTEIDTGDSNDLTTIDCLDNWKYLYTGTNDANGEVIQIDEATSTKLTSDIRFLLQQRDFINTRINTVNASVIDSKFTFLRTQENQISSDLRFLKYAYNQIPLNAIARTDFHVYVDAVELDDVDLASIKVIRNADSYATAEFIVARRHDNIDQTLGGVSSEISNQNEVTIYIQSILVFTGKIRELECLGSSESIRVNAQSSTRETGIFNQITLPLASVSVKRHLYDVILDDIRITNSTPPETRQIIVGSNGRYWNNSEWLWKRDREDATIYNDFDAAQTVIFAIPDDDEDENEYFHDEDPKVTNYDESPEFFRGIIVDLGYTTEEMVSRSGYAGSHYNLALQVDLGEFKPKQNREYFWRAAGVNFIDNVSFNKRYIGTSPSGLTSDSIWITELTYNWQRRWDSIETYNGQYVLGLPPYQSISTRNGRYISKWIYEDRNDGLYSVLSSWYNYIQYAKDVAAIEYQKMKSINDEIAPVTEATLSLTIDAYLFYGIDMLTRVNLDNTTEAGIYKNQNGFPVAVKSINIDSNAMTVTLETDNQLSKYEMDLLDDTIPDEESPDYYQEDEIANWIATKYDPSRREDVQ